MTILRIPANILATGNNHILDPRETQISSVFMKFLFCWHFTWNYDYKPLWTLATNKICEISPNLGQLSTPHLCLYDLLSTSQQGGEEVRGLVSCVLATPWRGWKGGHSQQYLYLLLSTAHHSLHLSVHWSPQQESLDPGPWTCELLSISKYLKLNPSGHSPLFSMSEQCFHFSEVNIKMPPESDGFHNPNSNNPIRHQTEQILDRYFIVPHM